MENQPAEREPRPPLDPRYYEQSERVLQALNEWNDDGPLFDDLQVLEYFVEHGFSTDKVAEVAQIKKQISERAGHFDEIEQPPALGPALDEYYEKAVAFLDGEVEDAQRIVDAYPGAFVVRYVDESGAIVGVKRDHESNVVSWQLGDDQPEVEVTAGDRLFVDLRKLSPEEKAAVDQLRAAEDEPA